MAKGIKTGGRKKNTPNKVTLNLRESITVFLEGNFEKVTKDWEIMEPKDRLTFYKDLLRYAVPTLQSTGMKIDFDKMTDGQLDKVVENILKEGRQ